jgi:hypothetical protein
MANLTDWIATNEGNQTSRVYDISDQVAILSSFKPLIFNMAMARFEPTMDVRFQWDEVDYSTAKTKINHIGGYSAGATEFVVDDASIFTDRDLVRNLRTEEVYQVTDINLGTNTITVVRHVGDTSGSVINDDDVVLIIGPGFEEASSTPDQMAANTTTEYNYCQIFRRAWAISGTRVRTLGTPGMHLEDLSARKAEEFTRDVEYAFIFGKRDQDTSSFSKVRHTTNGLSNSISTNVESVGGTLSESDWETFLVEKAFYKGSSEKVMICGDAYFKCLSKWGKQFLQTTLDVNTLGIHVSTYIAPTGEILHLYNHPLFKGDATLAGLGIVVDPSEIAARFTQNPLHPQLNGRIQFREQIQAPGADGIINEYFAEIGLELRNEAKHAIIKGVTGPAT